MGAEAWTDRPSVFHAGEQEVQRIAGTRDLSEKLGRSWHSPIIPAGNVALLKKRSFIYLSCLDKQDRLWASVLFGLPGFIDASEASRVHISPVHRLAGDPLDLAPGCLLGTYCIDLATRQRCRQNGVLAHHDAERITMDVRVAFASCPKFIQARTVSIAPKDLQAHEQRQAPVKLHRGGSTLGPAEKELISRLDTMHLASCYQGSEAEGGSQGCDISHRGGPPGFVQLQGEGTLFWADYIGNYTFTSLGNLHADKRAGILFLDYRTGDTLQLTGECEIRWEEHALPGAERTLYFTTHAWVRAEGAVPCHVTGDHVAYSPYNPDPTCAFSVHDSQDRKLQLQNNYVKQGGSCKYLRCLRRHREAEGITSYTFEYQPSSRAKVLPDFKAGQYGSFEFEGLGQGNQKTIVRTWTLSSPPGEAMQRNSITLTVKKIGLVSAWLEDNMHRGRVIGFRGFEGVFTPSDCCPEGLPEAGVLLIAGGIGITPLKAMLADCLAAKVPTTLLYSVRAPAEAAFLQEFAEAAQQPGSCLHVHLFISSTAAAGEAALQLPEGISPHVGRITARAVQQVVPNLGGRAAFLCGPTEMMAAMASALNSLDFPLLQLHQESFSF